MQLRQVGLPTEPGGRRDEPDGRAPTEHVPLQQPVDEVAVADEVDPLDAFRPVGHAGAREQRIHPAAAGVDGGFDGGPLGQVDVHRLDAGQGDGGDIGDHDLGAGVPGQLGRGRAHAGRPAHDQDALVVVAECIEDGHLIPPAVTVRRRRLGP